MINTLSASITKWQFADELFECVWPFCNIGASRVKISLAILPFLTKIVSTNVRILNGFTQNFEKRERFINYIEPLGVNN